MYKSKEIAKERRQYTWRTMRHPPVGSWPSPEMCWPSPLQLQPLKSSSSLSSLMTPCDCDCQHIFKVFTSTTPTSPGLLITVQGSSILSLQLEKWKLEQSKTNKNLQRKLPGETVGAVIYHCVYCVTSYPCCFHIFWRLCCIIIQLKDIKETRKDLFRY